MAAILDAALSYARAGLYVFPAPRGTKMSYKSARYNGGARWGATCDELEIRTDWERWPTANVCIVTGADSGIFVIETDTFDAHGVDGEKTLTQLCEKMGEQFKTRQARSPSGSIHYYFKWPNDGRIVRNDTGRKIGVGVDIRGEGGMVVAPPSERDDGSYTWLNNHEIYNAPRWLLKLIAEEPRTKKETKANDGGCSIDLLSCAMDVVPIALDWHSRNNTGMALWSATGGSEAGFAIWDAWLRKSGKYRAGAAWKRWQAMHNCPPADIGAGTIFFQANEADADWLKKWDMMVENEMAARNWSGVEYMDWDV